jgi:hypothetical protein
MPFLRALRLSLFLIAMLAAFGVAVDLISFFVGHELIRGTVTQLVDSAIAFLILAGAGYAIGRLPGGMRTAWWVGGLAGGLAELVRVLISAEIISLSPQAQAAFNRLSQAQQAQAQDLSQVAITVGSAVLAMAIFGAVVAALGAWTAVRFGPTERLR